MKRRAAILWVVVFFFAPESVFGVKLDCPKARAVGDVHYRLRQRKDKSPIDAYNLRFAFSNEVRITHKIHGLVLRNLGSGRLRYNLHFHDYDALETKYVRGNARIAEEMEERRLYDFSKVRLYGVNQAQNFSGSVYSGPFIRHEKQGTLINAKNMIIFRELRLPSWTRTIGPVIYDGIVKFDLFTNIYKFDGFGISEFDNHELLHGTISLKQNAPPGEDSSLSDQISVYFDVDLKLESQSSKPDSCNRGHIKGMIFLQDETDDEETLLESRMHYRLSAEGMSQASFVNIVSMFFWMIGPFNEW